MDLSPILRYTYKDRFAPLIYMKNKVDTSENHLKTAIQYAMVGNYIDFGALENVNESELKAQLDEAINIKTIWSMRKGWFILRITAGKL